MNHTSQQVTAPTWSNWWGGHQCEPTRLEIVKTENEIRESISRAASEGLGVRVAGGGHSFGPVVVTDDVLLDVRLNGSIQTGPSTVTVPGSMHLSQLFDPLWESGAALRNMGELETVSIAGAISTGVHGTGLTLPSISSSVRELRIITASGDTLTLSEKDGDQFRAATLAIGMLGVITKVTLETLPAYDLVEDSFFLTPEEALESWDELLHKHRNFSFYYLPSPRAAETYSLLPSPPEHSQEICYATVRDASTPGQPTVGPGPFQRRDRMNRILSFDYDLRYREIEFAIPLEEAKTVYNKVRALIKDHHPDYAHPIDVRFVAQENSFLSWASDGPKAIFSVPETASEPYQAVLAGFEELFYEHGGRPHWGKEHTLTRSRLDRLQPGAEPFREVRRELDPTGIFLNEHLRPLFE
ncbi:D-arabinono-1,4-lactone oxidase [Paenarthrobacter sp. NPDC089989]|uniref:D-arabinono-1,4-lactone oxidase n=1 Tax=unclassified Paenarthrobacter TaxID=2634190 RepID=UPI0037F2E258